MYFRLICLVPAIEYASFTLYFTVTEVKLTLSQHQAVTFKDVKDALVRIQDKIHKTPIFESHLLNDWLGHRVLFKIECLQKTGAFKFRGACNVLSALAEHGALPKRIVANSSGNHAQAIACAASIFNIPATIFTTQSVSQVKAAATEFYGATVKKFATRVEADAAVAAAAESEDVLWVPPFNHPLILAGQGTAALEALRQLKDMSANTAEMLPDAIFAPCGGGGLLSGTYLAAKGTDSKIQVIGAEPLNANDAARSLRAGEIISLEKAPNTLADGAATPSVGEHTFPILQKTDGFYEVDEYRIAYWTQWLQHLLKIHVEPTCAMTMEAVCQWLKEGEFAHPQTCLVMLSGGNIDQQKMQQIWAEDHLTQLPSL